MADSVIPYGKQCITQADIDAVVETLKSDYLTQGPKVSEFEKAFADYVGAGYAVAVANGTAALHLNALVLGVEPGHKVITTPITFAASANCIRYCGGEVLFADIDPETYLLDFKNVRRILESDKKVKGIVAVDFAGRSVDMEALRLLADEFDCWIIEDACHAPGAYFVNSKGDRVQAGSGKYADLSIFSFHPVKHIAAGEGGMITTNDEELYKRLMELRSHGIIRDKGKFQNSVEVALGEQGIPDAEYPAWYMEMQDLGYNYRMPDINCALGLSQLSRADESLKRRYGIAYRYHQEFKGIPQVIDKNFESETYQQTNSNPHSHHLYVIEIEDRLGLYNYLRENQVYAQIHYIPTHLMPYYQELGYKNGDFPNAEEYYSRCLSLPMYPTLLDKEQSRVIHLVKEFYHLI